MIASYRHDLFVAFDSPVLGVPVEALRLADSRRDRVVLEQVCRQWRSMTGAAIEPRAVEAAASAGGDFLRAWADAVEEAGQGRAALRRIRADLVDGMDFPGIVDSFLDGGWRSWAKGDLADAAGEEVEIWRILHREIARSDPGATPSTYMRCLDLASKAPPPAPDALRCMTVHRSKGLQFGHVYLVGMAQDVFPSYRALRQGSGEVEEERRSCFVAIARAPGDADADAGPEVPRPIPEAGVAVPERNGVAPREDGDVIRRRSGPAIPAAHGGPRSRPAGPTRAPGPRSDASRAPTPPGEPATRGRARGAGR